MLSTLQNLARSFCQPLDHGKILKSWSVTGKKCLSCSASPRPSHAMSFLGHIQAGLSIVQRRVRSFSLPARDGGEPAGFTACGREATASSADLGRDGVRQPRDLLLGPHPAPGLSRGLTPLMVPRGWQHAYGGGGGRWGPGSAGGPGCWWPGGPRPGGCRHLESRRRHGVDAQHPASSCPGSFRGWSVGWEREKRSQVLRGRVEDMTIALGYPLEDALHLKALQGT